MVDKRLQKEIRSRLEAAFKERLHGIVLYGSYARGTSVQESDLDLMVLLEMPVQLGRDLETIVEALYPVQLELDAPIHALPVSEESFKAGQYGLYRNAQREGIFF